MTAKNNIVLIGMPAAGKSTIGVLLAKVLQKNFVDTDLIIQQKCGCQLQTLLDNVGLEDFCKIEQDCILGLDCENTVIATGGSAVYSRKAMEKLQQNGIVVYLHLEFAEIEKRLTNIDTRGVVIAKGQTLAELYKNRQGLYKKYADITIDSTGLTHEQTVSMTTKKINN